MEYRHVSPFTVPVCVWRGCLCWLIAVYLFQSMVGVTHKEICEALRQEKSTVCLCHTALCLQSLSSSPLIHLLSSRWLSPLVSHLFISPFWMACSVSSFTVASLPLMSVNSHMRSSDRTWPWTQQLCSKGIRHDQKMRTRDGGKADESTRAFSGAEGQCKIQNQKRGVGSENMHGCLWKGPCCICWFESFPVHDHEPLLRLLLSFLKIADIRGSGVAYVCLFVCESESRGGGGGPQTLNLAHFQNKPWTFDSCITVLKCVCWNNVLRANTQDLCIMTVVISRFLQ